MISIMFALATLAFGQEAAQVNQTVSPAVLKHRDSAASERKYAVVDENGNVVLDQNGNPVMVHQGGSQTVNGSVVGRPAASVQVCGVYIDTESIAAKKLVAMMAQQPECTDAITRQIAEINRGANTDTALRLGRDVYSSGDTSATGTAAVLAADRGSYGYGYTGLPYGASVVDQFRRNADAARESTVRDALQAHTSPPPQVVVVTQPPAGVVTITPVAGPTKQQIEAAEALDAMNGN